MRTAKRNSLEVTKRDKWQFGNALPLPLALPLALSLAIPSKIRSILFFKMGRLIPTQNLCKVCADKTFGRHYGAWVCDGCSCFFKRSIRRSAEYKCVAGTGKCLVDKCRRNWCQACRFNKCIAEANMAKERVQKERGPRKAKRSKSGERNEVPKEAEKSQRESGETDGRGQRSVVSSLPPAVPLSSPFSSSVLPLPPLLLLQWPHSPISQLRRLVLLHRLCHQMKLA
ncbi:hypothetical protein niasHT_005082 [Heterodera trifolii]|uniref:Nuclear receptor domain-containing protein n=1 Tax=Heterodera trifolii TaxID=157864 RepID=A0ABD2M3W3_9BILA